MTTNDEDESTQGSSETRRPSRSETDDHKRRTPASESASGELVFTKANSDAVAAAVRAASGFGEVVPSIAAFRGLDGVFKTPEMQETINSILRLTSARTGLDSLARATSSDAMRAVMAQSRGAALNDWAMAFDAILGPRSAQKSRRHRRSPTEFYAEFEVEVTSKAELLRALSVLQQKNSHLNLVWRGQQDASWGIDSSLTRRLRDDGRIPSEDNMVAVETFQLGTAGLWGFPQPLGDLTFFAELQHEGAPTRFIDVSLDPEIATWFAVQEDAKFEEVDARIVAWGRSPAPRQRHPVEQPLRVPNTGGTAFWHAWRNDSHRQDDDWGTGRTIRCWHPTAFNERMRAQRAAFLFDAEPQIDENILATFNDHLQADWRTEEIATATRIIGLPSKHDKRVRYNSEQIVPMFTLRINASARQSIRTYLANKGIYEPTMYPDRAGMIASLRRIGTLNAVD